MTTERKWEQTIDEFIKEWCKPEYVPHLLDSDENAGQRLRDLLAIAEDKARQSVLDELEKGMPKPNSNNFIGHKCMKRNEIDDPCGQDIYCDQHNQCRSSVLTLIRSLQGK